MAKKHVQSDALNLRSEPEIADDNPLAEADETEGLPQ